MSPANRRLCLAAAFALLLPGGRAHAQATAGSPCPFDIAILDLKSGRERWVTNSADACEYKPNFAPDGKSIIYLRGHVDESGWVPEGLWLTELESGATRHVDGPPACADVPAYSRNGRELTFSSSCPGSGSMFLMPAKGGAITTLSTTGLYDGDWSPNSEALVCTQAPQGIAILSLESGQSFDLTNGVGFDPVWAPDGRWIAYATDDLDSTMSTGLRGALWRLAVDPKGRPHGAPEALAVVDGWISQSGWLNDSRGLVFNSNDGIWRYQDGKLSLLRGSTAYDPAVSKDGRFLVFSAQRP